MSESWHPSADLAVIRDRAAMNADIRRFFAERSVLEVETPILAAASVSDLHIDSITTADADLSGQIRYLQTSPEYAMKRLLAAGSPCIYQLSRVFRQGESSSRHNPEFSLLEWYRLGFDDRRLMSEVAELLSLLLGLETCEYLSYREAYQRELGIDPHLATESELAVLGRLRVDASLPDMARDEWLDLLTSFCIEPSLGRQGETQVITFLYDYPASQAALARVAHDSEGQLVAKRFEVFVDALEIANGYYELSDPQEQQLRFERDIEQRRVSKKRNINVDQRLLDALVSGLPDCAGVALGLDRVLMLRNKVSRIRDVLTFAFDIA
jgi:lysyl-tRNA synthetase class 2